MEECVFCKIIAGEIPSKIVYQNERILAFEDINPKAPIHILIVPKKHLEFKDLDISEVETLGNLILVAKNLAEEFKIQDSGYRLILNCGKDAGQEIAHIHLHLLGGKNLGPMIS